MHGYVLLGSLCALAVLWFLYRRHRRKVLRARLARSGKKDLGLALGRILNPDNRDLLPKENHDRS